MSSIIQYTSLIQYMDDIYLKCAELLYLKQWDNLIPNTDKNIMINTDNYNLLEITNFTATQLKQSAKPYKLKLTGTKHDITNRLYSYLLLTDKSTIIQKYFRKYLVQTFIKCKGPALFNRSICVNPEDFLTLDKMSDIPGSQFFSFKEEDNFVYGFDMLSFHNLIEKTTNLTNLTNTKQIENPYNRTIINSTIFGNYKRVLHLGKILNLGVVIQIEDIKKTVSVEKSLEFRVLDLFQNINALGNYSDAEWFNNLQRPQLYKYVKELLEIWNFRSQISEETKRLICFPHGKPFGQFNYSAVISEYDICVLKKHILLIMENMCNLGVDKDNKMLGAYYVLGALTLVSFPAANALPWLYQSMVY